MAEERRTTVLAMDGSTSADKALHCEIWIGFFIVLYWCFSSKLLSLKVFYLIYTVFVYSVIYLM